MDVLQALQENERLRKVIYDCLMTNATLYDGKERYTQLLQGTLAEGENQNEFQLGHIYKGDFHSVPVPENDGDGHWLIHTHGRSIDAVYHPPSLQDVLITIQRTSNNRYLQGISIIVALEGMYVLFPRRSLVQKLLSREGKNPDKPELDIQTTLKEKLKKEYPIIFNNVRCGLKGTGPQTIVEYLESVGMICAFIAQTGY